MKSVNFKEFDFSLPLLTKTIVGLGYVLSAFLLAKFSLHGLGESSRLSTTIAVTLFFMLFTPSKLTFWLVVFPISLLAGLYFPITHVYGLPDYQALISLLSTNKTEASEFLSLISAKLYLQGACIPILAVVTHLLAKYSGLKLWRNKTFVLVSVLFLVAAQPPAAFYTHTKKAIKSYLEIISYSAESTWSMSNSISPPKDYILVIGESARRDYFHIYGYPIDNTPFLDTVNGVIVDGLSAGGIYTIESLGNMLTKGTNWNPRYDRSLVNLAKSAGFETFWLTAQGTIGKWDTPVTSMATQADNTVFLGKGNNFNQAHLSDVGLVDSLKDVLNKTTDKSRLIILHTIGSHYDACNRVSDMEGKYEVSDAYYDYVACYVSSIKQTDQLLERIYNVLEDNRKKTGRQYSIIYFSDHGELHYERDGRFILNHSVYHKKQSKFIYDVPLVKIDSQSQEHKELKSKKNGLRFTDGLANWMDISNPDIDNYDLFDGKNDTSDFGLSKKIKSFSFDPAVDLTPILKPSD